MLGILFHPANCEGNRIFEPLATCRPLFQVMALRESNDP